MASNLKLCPFCGGEAESYHAAERKPDFDGSIQAHWVVDCSECNANMECWTTQDDAEKAWNTRNTTALEARVLELEGLLVIWQELADKVSDHSIRYDTRELLANKEAGK